LETQSSLLAELLQDPEPYVRVAAGEALGEMGKYAKDEIPGLVELLEDREAGVREAAAKSLGAMGELAKEQLPRISELLTNQDAKAREAAIMTLVGMGEHAKGQAPKIAALLDDPSEDVRLASIIALGAVGGDAHIQTSRIAESLTNPSSGMREAAATTLGAMGPFGISTILSVVSGTYLHADLIGELRLLAHFLGGGEEDVELLLAWLGRPAVRPAGAAVSDRDQTLAILRTFLKAWDLSAPFPDLRMDLARQIAQVVNSRDWEVQDIFLLEAHEANLTEAGFVHALTMRDAIRSIQELQWLATTGKILALHASFWLILIVLYPRFPQIQAMFFWNPWVRRISGLGYVEFALTWIPFLRSSLFMPFRTSLVADAALNDFDEEAYYKGSNVTVGIARRSGPVCDEIPEVKGQIVLEGESGLGKTMFLRFLVQRSKRMIVYLPAWKCVDGVMEAIQAKLHGLPKDPKFLRNLIYSGAIDICIDGLNEVSADIRAKVTSFMESYFKANVLVSTQPLEWTPPSTSKLYILEPLSEPQIELFLLARESRLPDDALLTGGEYGEACRRYLSIAFDSQQSQEIRQATQRVLSNPMDLTTVAMMLARKQVPDVFQLQKQQYQLMADDYQRVNMGEEFPLSNFSESIYQMSLDGRSTIRNGEFTKALQCMQRHKMVITRYVSDTGEAKRREWHFRHNKIMDFFIVQTFIGADNERPKTHLGDPRFRGVYFLLATLLPLKDAAALREQLIEYAADTRDHTVSDSFIQLLRARKVA
jgi:hypothetical protein